MKIAIGLIGIAPEPSLLPGGTINAEGGTINGGSGEINGRNGEILRAIECHPGIKREGLLLETRIPLRTIDRILQRLTSSGAGRIEYRGSKKTGGWFIKP